MGYSYDAYVAYGLYVPVDPYGCDDAGQTPDEQVDLALSVPEVKAQCPDVGHLRAGAVDADRFFLVTDSQEAELGRYHRMDWFTRHQMAAWDEQLAAALHVLGWDQKYPYLEQPGWFLVADLS